MRPDQLTASIIQSLGRGDSHLKQTGDIAPFNAGSVAGGSAEFETISPMPRKDGNPQSERDWLVAFPRGQSDALFLVFVAPAENYDELRPTFERMVKSIQF